MVKKGYAVFFIAFLLVIAICSRAYAEDAAPGMENLQDITGEGEKVEKLLAELEGIKSESDPAAQIWHKYLENSTIGKAAIKLGLVLKKADPVLKQVPGAPFSWTGFFFITLILMLALFMLIRGMISATKLPKWATYAIAAGATIILSVIGLFSSIGKAISDAVTKIPIIWVRIIVYAVIIILIFFVEKAALGFRKGMEKERAQTKKIEKIAGKEAEKKIEEEEEKEEVKQEEAPKESVEERAGKNFLQKLGQSLTSGESSKGKKVKTEATETPFD